MLVKLKEICKVVSGATPTTNISSYYDGDIFWITPKDLADNNSRKYINTCSRKITKSGYESCSTVMIPKNNILISTRAPIGYIAINSVECCTNQGFKSLICDANIVNSNYLYYLLKTRMKEIELLGAGTTFKEVSKSSIENFEVDLPLLEIQERIASILSSIDCQIERNNTILKRLQVLGQGIFFKWFVQSEYPKSNEEKIFNKFLNNEIPSGWKTYRLTDCIKWESSSQPPKSTFSDIKKEGYIRFIQNRDYDSANHVTYIPLKETTKTCNKFDIMIDKYGDAGKIRYGLTGAFNVALAKLTPIFPYTQEYIRHFLMLDANYTYLHNACIASTRASLNEQTLSGIKICMPPMPLLRKFDDISKKILNYQFKIIDETSKLEELKRKILPLLINEQLK